MVADTVHVILTGDDVQARLNELAARAQDLSPAMRAIAQTLLQQTEENFRAEGRPKWRPLAASTILARIGGAKAFKKNGDMTKAAQRRYDGLKILQASGALAASITPESGRDYALIGSNKVYAAIHQLGGQAGRNKATTIVARPYLPVTAEGELQAEAVPEVLGAVMRYLSSGA